MLHIGTLLNTLFHLPFFPSTFYASRKVYKTITIKYNLKQNVTNFSSEAHGFFNLLTANLVKNLKDIHPPFRKRALSLNKTSSKFLPPIITENPLDQSSTTTENPLDQSSFNFDDQFIVFYESISIENVLK